jgi:hypothetical protein
MYLMYSMTICGLPSATIDIGVYTGQSSFEVRDLYSIGAVTASTTTPHVTIGSCEMSAADEDHFSVKGATKSGWVTWDLSYSRADGIPPYFPSHGPHESAYLCYMISADVTGTVTLFGKTYAISGNGYHDHNWGAPPFDADYWYWAEAYDANAGAAIHLEKTLFNSSLSRIAVLFDGTQILFDNPLILFSGLKYGIKFAPLISFIVVPVISVYPQVWTVSAANADGYEISLEISVEKVLSLYMGSTPYAIEEGVSHFSGSLTHGGEILMTFDTYGFTEYTH